MLLPSTIVEIQTSGHRGRPVAAVILAVVFPLTSFDGETRRALDRHQHSVVTPAPAFQ